eukprot:superscaffoldBa00002806_g15343
MGVTPVAPWKQCVAALKKRMFLIMEYPTINVVEEKRGQGDDGCGFSWQKSAQAVSTLRIAKGVSVLTHGAMALRRDQGATSRSQYAGNCQSDGNQTHRVPDRISGGAVCHADRRRGPPWESHREAVIVLATAA